MAVLATFTDRDSGCLAKITSGDGKRRPYALRYYDHRGTHLDASDRYFGTYDEAVAAVLIDHPVGCR